MNKDLVTIATFRSPPEAEAAKLHLEAAGLTPFLADVETVNMDWLLGNAIGDIKLQVPNTQAETAAALLKHMRSERQRRRQQTGSADANMCLACGAVLPEEESQCGACGWSYAMNDDSE
jgi:hypothetical protein